MAFGSYYSQGGQNADYTANFGGGAGGNGGGGANLSSQFNALSSFDPSAYLNAMLKYGADQQRFAYERRDWERGRARNDARTEANRMSQMMGQPDPYTLQAQSNAMQRDNAQTRALTRPAPSRMTTFASNATNYAVPDDMAMSGYQRQIYLPQDARGGRF